MAVNFAKKEQDRLAMEALIQQMPEVRKVLEKNNITPGGKFASPKQVASIAMISSLQKKGISFDKVCGVLSDCLDAKQPVILRQPVEEGSRQMIDIVEYAPDYKTQLNAVKLYMGIMGVERGIEMPSIDTSTEPSSVTISFGAKEPEESEN